MESTPLWLQIVAIGLPAAASVVAAVVASRYAARARLAEGRAARLLALEERTSARRADVYLPFVKTLGDLLTPARRDLAVATMEDVMADFHNFVTVWGSDDVVASFYRFRRGSTTSPPPAIMMRLTADLLLAIRRDLAWPDSSTSALEIMGSRITDLEPGGDLESAFTMPFEALVKREKWAAPWS